MSLEPIVEEETREFYENKYRKKYKKMYNEKEKAKWHISAANKTTIVSILILWITIIFIASLMHPHGPGGKCEMNISRLLTFWFFDSIMIGIAIQVYHIKIKDN